MQANWINRASFRQAGRNQVSINPEREGSVALTEAKLTEANYPESSNQLAPWAGYQISAAQKTADTLPPGPFPAVIRFSSKFDGRMALKGDIPTVMAYLDNHSGWFCRCAQPMTVEPLNNNGYLITVGRFGSHGFEVEPKIGLHLLPQNKGVYRIETLHQSGGAHDCYEVDFQAELELVEAPESTLEAPLTHVQWTLNLGVDIQFPRFIYRLPMKLIRYTGDQVLAQIVRQVSKRLTAKVQDDFHDAAKASS